MATVDPIDDLFRKALKGIDPPPPPALDMAAMARAAKIGAAASAAGRARDRWLLWKRFGAIVVLLIALSFALRSVLVEVVHDAQEVAADPSTITTPHNALPAGATEDEPPVEHFQNTPAAPTHEEAIAVDSVVSSGTMHPDPRGSGSAGTQAQITATPDEAMLRNKQPQRQGDDQRMIGSASTDVVGESGTDATGPVEANEQLSEQESRSISDPDDILLSVAEVATASDPRLGSIDESAGGPHSEPMHTSVERMQPRPIISQADSLSLVPTSVVVVDVFTDPFLPRFSVSPWFSMDNSTYSNGSGAALEQLDVDRGLTGTVGVRLQYAMHRHWALLSGVQYSCKGDLHGIVRTSADHFTAYELSGTYYEVPLAIKYTVPAEGKEYYARVGTSFQFNSRGGRDRVMVHAEDVKELSTVVLSSGSLGTTLDIGIGVQFWLRKGLGLFIEPAYRVGLSPMVKHPTFDQLPFNPNVNSLSLGMGLTFQLNNR